MSIITWDNGGADSLWSTDENWAGDVAPTVNDTAKFDGTSDTASTCDIAEVGAVDIDTGYTSTITQSAALYIAGDMIAEMDAGARWNMSTFDLTIDGDVNTSGDGDGIRRSNGGTLYLGGNYTNTCVNAATMGSGQPVRWQHSRATPTIVKTHQLQSASFSRRMDYHIFGTNQTVEIQSDTQGGAIEFQDGSELAGAFEFDSRNGVWITPNLARFTIDRIKWRDSVGTIVGADYGNAILSISPNNPISFIGALKTTNTLNMSPNGNGSEVYTLQPGASFDVDRMVISSSVTTKSVDFVQAEGSRVTVRAGGVLVRQDDTVAKSAWTRNSTSHVTIEGQLVVEVDAELDWSGDSEPAYVGGFDFQNNSIIGIGSNHMVIQGDGTIQTKNPDNGNRAITTEIPDGQTWRTSGNVYSDNVEGPAVGNATVVGSGQILVINFVNGTNVTWNADVDGGITFNNVDSTLTAYDYGNCTVVMSVGGITMVRGDGDGTFTADTLDVFRLQIPSNTTATIGEDFNVNVRRLRMGNSSSSSRGGKLVWNSTGELCVTERIQAFASDGVVVTGLEIGAGAGLINCDGFIDFAPNTTFTCLGLATISIEGNITFNATATVTWGACVLALLGDSTQDITFNSNPFTIVEWKTDGGVINYNDAWTLTGNHLMRVRGSVQTNFLAGGSYGANQLNITRTAGIGDTTYVTIDSSDGSTQFDYTVNSAGPTARNADFNNMNFLGADQPCDQNSCLDSGNNNISPPSPGLVFIDDPIPAPGFNFGSFGNGIGVGVGVGGGAAYPIN